ncbi:MAG TPA: 16S rRNA (guanine(527)-N(7))-methyltransferase RsmG [Alphaproteobacteria bacterium]|nr:16S rRNA (guanine(527)-N(7))-methyltransferase RsmG [Alphaproteobacteria bacterium]
MALTPEEFRDRTGVSRETLSRLSRYAELLVKWQARINLVGRSTISDLWHRHMLDSAQLFPLLPKDARLLVDLGSGAGFPGLVLAILGVPEVHLIESDTRKAAFLREVSRETSAGAMVHAVRIEQAPAIEADAVTARALAPLPVLLEHAGRFATANSVLLFPKGQDVGKELTDTPEHKKMTVDAVPSITDSSGTILRITGFVRA